jgi:hypothetical protein
MPIFQAESRIFFDPFLLFEPGEVFREKHGVLLYFFCFLFRENNIKAWAKMGKAYSLPSCPDQLAVSFWIPDPVTYHVLSYPE